MWGNAFKLVSAGSIKVHKLSNDGAIATSGKSTITYHTKLVDVSSVKAIGACISLLNLM